MRKMPIFLKQYGLIMLAIFSIFMSVIIVYLSLVTFGNNLEVNETSVGYIYLGNNTVDEYQNTLIFGVNDWKSKASYRINYQGYEYNIDLSIFNFDVDSTLARLIQNTKNNAIFSVNESDVTDLKADLTLLYGSDLMDSFDMDQLISTILTDMGKLYYLRYYELNDFLDTSVSESVINTKIITNILPSDVTQIMAYGEDVLIPANTRFSLLGTLGSSNLTSEQLSIIASGLENLILKTSFSGISKYYYQEMPDWASIGSNIRILKVNQYDFQFFNNENLDYTLTFTQIDSSTIEFTLLGYPFVSDYDCVIDSSVQIPFETIIVDDDTITSTTANVMIEETATDWIYSVVEIEGVNGMQVIFTRVITDAFGDQHELYLMSENKLPVSAVIRQNIVSKED